MDNYIVSARKYRPQTFLSVVGQYSITQTLKSAVKTKQLAHAYLFCGPRGVGKTTCARIFAKAINCFSPNVDNEPCNECESCKSFNSNRSYNIHELDAASNNSVDDIRSLIEQVRIQPRIGKYSVYIVDEVHMLSTAAFNAFLKTLEEPPAHAVFVLATTEKHKIIPTVLSRCQVFDFNRIRTEDTIEHLKYVAKSENVTADVAALRIIAQKSDGGMRDALSIFDQLVSFTAGNISYQNTVENLNILDTEFYFKTVDCILACNISDVMLIFDDVVKKGFDGFTFVSGLAEHFRNLLMSKNQKTTKLIDAGSEMETQYMQQAANCSTNLIFLSLQKLRECELNYKVSRNQRLHVELTLIDIGFCQFNIESKKKNPQTAVNSNNSPTLNTVPVEEKKLPVRPQSTVTIKHLLNETQQLTSNETVVTKTVEQSIQEIEPAPESKTVTNTEIEKTVEIIPTIEYIWQNIIEPYKNQIRLYVALNNSNPQIIENGELLLTLKSETQKDLIDEIKNEIIKSVKQSLSLSELVLAYNIDKQIDEPIKEQPKPQKPVNEILNSFIQRNNAVALLIQRFNLKT